jgi:hypothetical protein
MGSNYYPWGPHGERVSPLEVKPNPTPSTPSANFQAPNFAQPMPAPYALAYRLGPVTAADAADISRLGNFIFSAVVLGILWQFLVCLYPLPALAAAITAIYSAGFLVKTFPPEPALLAGTFFCVLVAYSAGIAVLYIAMRIEQRLARNAGYRIVRHVVRLALFALMAVFAIERASGIPLLTGPDPSAWSANVACILRTPDYLIAVFVFVVAMHFILWRADKLRAFWHRRLTATGLIP